MTKALVAVGMGIAFLPRIALHPVHPGVTVKTVEHFPARRVLAVLLPGTGAPATRAFLDLLGDGAAAYSKLPEPAQT